VIINNDGEDYGGVDSFSQSDNWSDCAEYCSLSCGGSSGSGK